MSNPEPPRLAIFPSRGQNSGDARGNKRGQILALLPAEPEIETAFIHALVRGANMTSRKVEVILKLDPLFVSVVFATLASAAAALTLALIRGKADKNRMAVAEKFATAALIGTAALAALLRQRGLW